MLKYLGTIATDAVTPKTNASTAAPFAIPKGATILVQPDADAFVQGGTDATTTTAGASGLKVLANGTWREQSGGFVATLGASGSVNLKVFAVLGERHA